MGRTRVSRNEKSLQALDALAGAERHESAVLIEQMLRAEPLSRYVISFPLGSHPMLMVPP